LFFAPDPELDPMEPVRAQVSYRYEGDPSNKIGTLRRDFGAKLSAWSWLSLDYKLALIEDQLFAGEDPNRLRDDQTQSVTLGVHYKISTTSLRFSEEKFAERDTIRSWQLSQSLDGSNFWLWRPRSNLHFRFFAALGGGANKDNSQSELSSSTSSSSDFYYNLRSNLNWRPSRNQQVKASAFQQMTKREYRNRSDYIKETEENSTSSSLTRTGLTLGYLFRYAAWKFNADYSYVLAKENLADRERTHSSVMFSLSRDLR